MCRACFRHLLVADYLHIQIASLMPRCMVTHEMLLERRGRFPTHTAPVKRTRRSASPRTGGPEWQAQSSIDPSQAIRSRKTPLKRRPGKHVTGSKHPDTALPSVLRCIKKRTAKGQLALAQATFSSRRRTWHVAKRQANLLAAGRTVQHKSSAKDNKSLWQTFRVRSLAGDSLKASRERQPRRQCRGKQCKQSSRPAP